MDRLIQREREREIHVEKDIVFETEVSAVLCNLSGMTE